MAVSWRTVGPIDTGNPNLYGITWSVAEAQFVMVGDSVGSGKRGIYTSPDGETWTARTHPFTATVVEICRSEADDYWVAGGSTSGEIAYSNDGAVTWTMSTQTVFSGSDQLNGIAYSAAEDNYVAVGSTGSATIKIATANDPSGTWTSRTPSASGTNSRAVGRSESLDQWVMATNAKFQKSSDGTTWADTVTASTSGGAVVWADALGLWLSAKSFTNFLSSTDGDNWTNRTAIGSSVPGMEWTPSYLTGYAIACEDGVSPKLWGTSNGTTWADESASMPSAMQAVAYSPSLSKWVCCGLNGYTMIGTEPLPPITDQAQTLIQTSTGRHW